MLVVGVLVLLVGLVVSIAAHEVGHLVPAKAFGVKVTEYMVGFGRTVWSRQRGETQYGVKALPLGGYIRMIGMFPPERIGRRRRIPRSWRTMIEDARGLSREEIGPGEEHRTFYRLPVAKRLLVMLGGPTVNLIIGCLLLFGTPMIFSLPHDGGTTVGYVAECVSPADDGSCAPGATPSAAKLAGLRAGDKVLAFGAVPVDSWEDLQAAIRRSADQQTGITVLRDGVRTTLPARIGAIRTADGQTIGYLGMSPQREFRRSTAGESVTAVGSAITGTFGVVLHLPQRMVDVVNAAFGDQERDPNGPVGIVGVTRISGDVASSDTISGTNKVAAMLLLLAGLNIALFVFNMLPLLPLDGGHIAGALFEGARRRVRQWRGQPDPGPFDTASLLPVAYVVAACFIVMSVLLAYADIVKPVEF